MKTVTQDTGHHLVHVAMFAVLYTIYAQHICPILGGLPWAWVFGPGLVTLAALSALRFATMRRLGDLREDLALRWGFRIDLALFVACGLALSTFNGLRFDVPWENLAKVSVSFLALGFYIALDLSLRRERRIAERLIATGASFPSDSKPMPFTAKFMAFSLINLVVLATVVLLVVWKDITAAAYGGMNANLHILIMLEVAFVVAVMVGYILLSILQYSRNMRLSIETERQGLVRVVKGELDTVVPIVTNDEFARIAEMTNVMTDRLRSTMDDLRSTQDATIGALVSLAAKRDTETGLHLKRTQAYVEVLAHALRGCGHHAEALDDATIATLRRSAPLHDIGKVGVPDEILQKPGKLTKAEFDVMKTHTTIGAAALVEAEAEMGGSSFLSTAREIAESHHEKWDGTGYPYGLAGEAIPLSGRLMALADVYDALRSKRCYKDAMSHEAACDIIRKGRGKHFDPNIVDAFENAERFFDEIAVALAEDRPDARSTAQTVAAAGGPAGLPLPVAAAPPVA